MGTYLVLTGRLGLDDFGQDVAALVGLFLAEGHGRQQADHRSMGAVDQQLSLQAGLDRRCPVDGQFHADHHAADADLANQIALLLQRGKPLLEEIAQALGGRQQVLLLDHLDGGHAGAGSDGIAAEGGGVHARPQAGGDLAAWPAWPPPAIPPHKALERVIMSGVTPTA